MKYYIYQMADRPLIGVPECDLKGFSKKKGFVLVYVCENLEECEHIFRVASLKIE